MKTYAATHMVMVDMIARAPAEVLPRIKQDLIMRCYRDVYAAGLLPFGVARLKEEWQNYRGEPTDMVAAADQLMLRAELYASHMDLSLAMLELLANPDPRRAKEIHDELRSR